MRHTALAALLLAAPCLALAQPTGADRMLDEAETKAALVKPGEVTRIGMTGGTSGRKFTMLLKPDGALDMRVGTGQNFGRDWKIEGNKFCIRAYAGAPNANTPICGGLELKDGKVYWVEDRDGSRNPFDAIAFEKP